MIRPASVSDKMRVAYLFQAPGIRFSVPQAAQLHIYYTIRGLQQVGHDAALFALNGSNILYTEDLGIFHDNTLEDRYYRRTGISHTRPFVSFESGMRRLQKELNLPYLALFDSFRMYDAGVQHLRGYDLFHERYNLLSVGGALASRRLGIPLILEVNADLLEQRRLKGKPVRGLRRLYAVWATRFCFNTAALIVSVSPQLTRHLQQEWQIPTQRLVTLPCAADTEAFDVREYSDKFQKQLGLNGEPVVMWIGGFYRWHDLKILIDSFARVCEQVPDAKLVLVGDGETRSQVNRQAEERGVREATIMTGAIPHTQIPEMVSIADVVVAPAPPIGAGEGGTGTPLKLFEYMAAGKAIVASAVSQARDVIENGETGLLVEPADSEAFSGAITSLLNDPAERRRLGLNARKRAEEKHSWQQYVCRLEEMYRQVVA